MILLPSVTCTRHDREPCCGPEYSRKIFSVDMNTNARIDALELMLTDLRMRNEPIRHKAAFRSCQPEFQSLVSRLIEQLEGELLEEKQRFREIARSGFS